jgi:accessory colonization factor AcfC
MPNSDTKFITKFTDQERDALLVMVQAQIDASGLSNWAQTCLWCDISAKVRSNSVNPDWLHRSRKEVK